MAELYTCPSCQRPMSSDLRNCPHCNQLYPKNEKCGICKQQVLNTQAVTCERHWISYYHEDCYRHVLNEQFCEVCNHIFTFEEQKSIHSEIEKRPICSVCGHHNSFTQRCGVCFLMRKFELFNKDTTLDSYNHQYCNEIKKRQFEMKMKKAQKLRQKQQEKWRSSGLCVECGSEIVFILRRFFGSEKCWSHYFSR